MKPYGYIYLVTNQVTGKHYVGQTTRTVDERWKQHVSDSLGGREVTPLFSNAIRKYGSEAFTVKALMYANNQAELNYLEQLAVDAFMSVTCDSGYNLTTGGGQGGKFTADVRARMSEVHKGRKFSPKHRANISAVQIGKVISTEARAKMSVARKGKRLSAEHRANISVALKGKNKGKTISADHLAKLIAINTGKPLSAEHRAKLIAANKGKPKSAETRAKLSVAHKGKTISAVQRAKLITANRVLTDEQVTEIATIYVPGKGSIRGNGAELAAKYGVSTATIRRTAKRYQSTAQVQGAL